MSQLKLSPETDATAKERGSLFTMQATSPLCLASGLFLNFVLVAVSLFSSTCFVAHFFDVLLRLPWACMSNTDHSVYVTPDCLIEVTV